MHLLAYISRYVGVDGDIQDELQKIASTAKMHNTGQGITGVLFYFDRKFLQFLEGEEPALRDLMSRIVKDSRHTRIECLVDQPIEKRSFSDWNMDVFNLVMDDTAGTEVVKGVIEAYKANFKMNPDRLVSIIKSFLLKQGPAVR